MENIKSLREEFASLVKSAEEVVNKGTEANEAEQAENAKRFARMEAIKPVLENSKRLAEFAFASNGSGVTSGVTLPREPEGKVEFERNIGVADKEAFSKDAIRKAVNQWALTGTIPQSFATITTATQSGILLPVTVAAPVSPIGANAFREAYAAWGIEPTKTDGTSQYNVPILDAAAGGQVAEGASSETENAPGLTHSIVSTCKTYQSGSVYFSGLQLSAVDFDLLSASLPALIGSKELGLESVIAAAMVADTGITQVTNPAAITGVDYASINAWHNSLPKKFGKQKVMLLSATAYASADGMVDDNHRPILVFDPTDGVVKYKGQTPVIRCDYLEALGATKVIGLLISLPGFHFRDAGAPSLARYTQVVGRPDQVGINYFAYHAYGYDVQAVAKYKTLAS